MALLIVAAFFWIAPIIWMFSLALTPNEILKTITTSLLPIQPTLENFVSVFRVGLTPRWFLNSTIVTVVTTVLTLILCSLAGYAFARLEFRGKKVVFPFVLARLMVPKDWNDYLWPLVSATQKEMFTITTGLASLQGNFAQATELGSLMARGVVASAPLLILFIIFQRQLIRGISVSSGGK